VVSVLPPQARATPTAAAGRVDAMTRSRMRGSR
jgi:hypothetical protein